MVKTNVSQFLSHLSFLRFSRPTASMAGRREEVENAMRRAGGAMSQLQQTRVYCIPDPSPFLEIMTRTGASASDSSRTESDFTKISRKSSSPWTEAEDETVKV